MSYVNNGRPANKCHDASQISFSNHRKSRTSNYFMILISFIKLKYGKVPQKIVPV